MGKNFSSYIHLNLLCLNFWSCSPILPPCTNVKNLAVFPPASTKGLLIVFPKPSFFQVEQAQLSQCPTARLVLHSPHHLDVLPLDSLLRMLTSSDKVFMASPVPPTERLRLLCHAYCAILWLNPSVGLRVWTICSSQAVWESEVSYLHIL